MSFQSKFKTVHTCERTGEQRVTDERKRKRPTEVTCDDMLFFFSLIRMKKRKGRMSSLVRQSTSKNEAFDESVN